VHYMLQDVYLNLIQSNCGSFCTRSKVRLAVKYSVVTFKLPPVKLLRRKR